MQFSNVMFLKTSSGYFAYAILLFEVIISSSLETNADSENISSAKSQNNAKFKIYLAGLFSIYSRSPNLTCERNNLIPPSIENSEQVFYAIDQINRDPRILPGVELAFNLTADCFIDRIALNEILQRLGGDCDHFEESDYDGGSTFFNNDRFWGLIGPHSSGVAVPVAKLLGLLNFSQISCGATSSALSDKQQFPSFFRTVPSDTYQVNAIIELLMRNQWHYVSFIHEDDDYGNSAFDSFRTQILNTSICVAQEIKLKQALTESNLQEIAQKLKQDVKAKVIIAFVFENRLRAILKHVYEQNSSDNFQWIGSDAWSELIQENCSDSHTLNNDASFLPSVLDGSIFFYFHFTPNENFEKYLKEKTIGEARNNNPYFAQYIAKKHNCSWEHSCSLKNNSLNLCCDDDLTLPVSLNLSKLRPTSCSNAVYAYAYALDEARKDLCGGDEVCDEFKYMEQSLLTSYLRNVSFNDSINNFRFQFDSAQDGPVWYDVLRYDKSVRCWNSIGHYTAANGLNITNSTAAEGRGKTTSTCSKECLANQFRVLHETRTCCWHCVDCPPNSGRVLTYQPSSFENKDEACYNCSHWKIPVGNRLCEPLTAKFLSFNHPLSWPVVIASSLGIALTLFYGVVYVWFWNTAVIRASGRELSFLILIGVFFLFVVPFLFCMEPTTIICGSRRFGVGFSFSLVFSGLLVKTLRISIVFNDLGKRLVINYKSILRPTPQMAIALLLTSVEVFMLIAWIFIQPPQISQASSPIDPNNLEKMRYRFINCEAMKTSSFLVGLGYPILLILVCTFYAIKIRKVPAGFNEAKFIGFAVYTTLVIWLAQLSSYFVQVATENQLRDVIYCMCLQLNALILLLALFGPKVYITLLRPKKNNQSSVMASRNYSFPSQVSTEKKIKHFETEEVDLGIGPRSQDPPVQLQSNSNADSNHCTCCNLRNRCIRNAATSSQEVEKLPQSSRRDLPHRSINKDINSSFQENPGTILNSNINLSTLT